LPAWLSFTASTRTFSGSTTGVSLGTARILVTATDPGGLSATDTFDLVVAAPVNRAPTVMQPVPDQRVVQGAA
jgi:hypothetical protein